MRRVALAVLLVAVTLCLAATPSNGDLVTFYLTVGPANTTNGATQLWRCNSDGTEPELLLEADLLGNVQADSYREILYYSQGFFTYMADLDGSNPTLLGYSYPIYDIVGGLCPFDVNCGYFCYFCDEIYICTESPDGSIQTARFQDFPGIVSPPALVGVALHIPSESGIEPPEPTSWGAIKSMHR
jgi:hypothetical protein